MNKYLFLIGAALFIALPGCANFFGSSDGSMEGYEVGPYPEAAYVYVDGQNRGVTPATLRIRRGFNESGVSILRNGEVVRSYLLELGNSYNRSELIYSYSASSDAGVPTYDVQDLNVTEEGTVIIPYFEHLIAIEDRQFGLTLLIGE